MVLVVTTGDNCFDVKEEDSHPGHNPPTGGQAAIPQSAFGWHKTQFKVFSVHRR
jgi:hypothetical protein